MAEGVAWHARARSEECAAPSPGALQASRVRHASCCVAERGQHFVCRCDPLSSAVHPLAILEGAGHRAHFRVSITVLPQDGAVGHDGCKKGVEKCHHSIAQLLWARVVGDGEASTSEIAGGRVTAMLLDVVTEQVDGGEVTACGHAFHSLAWSEEAAEASIASSLTRLSTA